MTTGKIFTQNHLPNEWMELVKEEMKSNITKRILNNFWKRKKKNGARTLNN